jgi:hypothetical protein
MNSDMHTSRARQLGIFTHQQDNHCCTMGKGKKLQLPKSMQEALVSNHEDPVFRRSLLYFQLYDSATLTRLLYSRLRGTGVVLEGGSDGSNDTRSGGSL